MALAAGADADERLLITRLVVPEVVVAGETLLVSVAATDPVGIELLELRLADGTLVANTEGERNVVEVFAIRDAPAGTFDLEARAVGVDGVEGDARRVRVDIGEHGTGVGVESPEEFAQRLAEWRASGYSRFTLYERGPIYLRGPTLRALEQSAAALRNLDDMRDQLDLQLTRVEDLPLVRINWWRTWSQGRGRQSFDWKSACGPGTPGVTKNGEVLACWLGLHPDIRLRMVWQEVDSNGGVEGMTYNEWPASLKTLLSERFHESYQWLSSNLAPYPGVELESPPINQVELLDDQFPVTAFDRSAALGLYIQNVAHVLALEIGGFVPWSILGYSKTDHFRLLSSPFLFEAGQYLDSNPGNPLAFNGWWPYGDVTPAPPTVTFQFLVDENILRPSHYDTIVRLLHWGRLRMCHFGGKPSAQNNENHWGYRGLPPTARTIVERVRLGFPGSVPCAWSAGCGGTSHFLTDLLRAVNIPVATRWLQDESGPRHRSPIFHTVGMALSHGDDVYDVRSNIPSTDPNYLPPEDVLITTQTFDEWFPGTVAGQDMNTSRQITEIKLDILPDRLMGQYCDDVLASKSHAGGSVYAGFERIYSVAELEAMGLWERLDAKEALYDFCPAP